MALGLERIGERWTLLIVRDLMFGPMRYSDLKAGMPGIATNMLANRLQEMQEAGIVAKRELPPPAAEGRDPVAAVRFGTAAAGISVTRHGAAPSMPTRDEVEALLAGA